MNSLNLFGVSIPERVLGSLRLRKLDASLSQIVVSIPERVLGSLRLKYVWWA